MRKEKLDTVFRVLASYRTIMNRVSAILEDENIHVGPSIGIILLALACHDRCTVKMLSILCGSTNTSYGIRKLESFGLVESTQSEYDMRLHIVRLTPEGARVARRLARALSGVRLLVEDTGFEAEENDADEDGDDAGLHAGAVGVRNGAGA